MQSLSKKPYMRNFLIGSFVGAKDGAGDESVWHHRAVAREYGYGGKGHG